MLQNSPCMFASFLSVYYKYVKIDNISVLQIDRNVTKMQQQEILNCQLFEGFTENIVC